MTAKELGFEVTINKVYLISHGDYSDYSVDFVISDKKKAYEICDKLNESSKYLSTFDVEERIILESYEQIEEFQQYITYVQVKLDGTIHNIHTTNDSELKNTGLNFVYCYYVGGSHIQILLGNSCEKTAIKSIKDYAAEVANELIQGVKPHIVVDNFNKRWRDIDV